tara:strand:+ start:351 stop:737 length:387 start_codon:yes stop_codon:yes gene_type:complete
MVTTETKPKKEKYTCDCGQKVTEGYKTNHEKGPKHQEWALTQPEKAPIHSALDHDLRSIINCDDSPALKAKSLRAAFAARDWPNPDHPGTIEDFLVEHNIPFYSFNKGPNMAEMKQNVIRWEKEQRYG